MFNATLTTDVQTVSLIDCQETKVDVDNVENVDDIQRVWLLDEKDINNYWTRKMWENWWKSLQLNQVQLNMNLI